MHCHRAWHGEFGAGAADQGKELGCGTFSGVR